jgi:uncharacterized membrane protein HdeD (DUF308 family)
VVVIRVLRAVQRLKRLEDDVITLGIILIIIGIFLFHPLLVIGAILAVIGVVLWILGATGRTIAGRRHWF